MEASPEIQGSLARRMTIAPPTIAGAWVPCCNPECLRSIRRSYVICLQSLNAIRRCQTSNSRGFNIGEFREMVKVRHDAEFAGLVSREIGSSDVLSPNIVLSSQAIG